MPAKPPTIVELAWTGDLTFSGSSHQTAIVLDGRSAKGPSPVQALGFALAGCMSTDIVDILVKGRHPLRAFRARLTAQRAQDEPHRFVRVELAVVCEGAVPPEAIERAIALSKDKYCSVWHSLRPDIQFTVSFERLE